MATRREQKLVDLCFELTLLASGVLPGRPAAEVAVWVAEQLRKCGFPTHPVGMSWGVLED